METCPDKLLPLISFYSFNLKLPRQIFLLLNPDVFQPGDHQQPCGGLSVWNGKKKKKNTGKGKAPRQTEPRGATHLEHQGSQLEDGLAVHLDLPLLGESGA